MCNGIVNSTTIPCVRLDCKSKKIPNINWIHLKDKAEREKQ